MRYNHILIQTNRKVVIGRNDDKQSVKTNLSSTQDKLKTGIEFEDVVYVTLGTKKSRYWLNEMIRYTSFKIIKKIGQDVLLERELG